MNAHSAAQTYREASIETASPIKIVRLMYEGALRFLDRAALALSNGSNADFTRALGRADAIVGELRASLAHEHAPKIGGDLDRLYEFVQQQIAESLVERKAEKLANARKVLATLLEGWAQVAAESPG